MIVPDVDGSSDGTIAEEVQRVLLDVGSWLKVNGEAIYGTRPWKIYGEGPTKVATGTFNEGNTAAYTAEDFRFTSKGGTVYAIELSWPSNGEAVIHAFGNDGVGNTKVELVSLLGSEARLQFEQKPDGLHIQLPAQAPCKYAYTFRMVLGASAH